MALSCSGCRAEYGIWKTSNTPIFDVVDKIRQNRGNAQEANLAGLLEVLERLMAPSRSSTSLAEVKLEHVQVVGLHTPQALVNGVDDADGCSRGAGAAGYRSACARSGRTGSHPAGSRT